MLLAALGRKKVYVPTTYTQTFTASATFVMPPGVSTINAKGHGAAGMPAVPGTDYYYTQVIIRYWRRDGAPNDIDDQTVPGWDNGAGNGANYCDAPEDMPDSTVYYQKLTCYYYRIAYGSGGTPATTGASATGFGKVFPGGTGGPATSDAAFTNVPVTAGATYQVVVPSGAGITITYTV